MADTKYDPSKVFVSTRLIRDENENGVVVDNKGEWKSGKLYVELYDSKTGNLIDGKTLEVSHAKYDAFREDFDPLSAEEVIKEHFPKVATDEASESDLQAAARDSKEQTEAREKEVKKTEEEDEKVRFLSADVEFQKDSEGKEVTDDEGNRVVVADNPSDFQNVRPVGDPDEVPSNPEQDKTAEEQIEEDDPAVGAPDNPEQRGTNVGEDNTVGKKEKESVTNSRVKNVTPVKE